MSRMKQQIGEQNKAHDFRKGPWFQHPRYWGDGAHNSMFGIDIEGWSNSSMNVVPVFTRMEINTRDMSLFEDERLKDSTGNYIERIQLIVFYDKKLKAEAEKGGWTARQALIDIGATLTDLGVSPKVAVKTKIVAVGTTDRTKHLKYKDFIEVEIEVPLQEVNAFLAVFDAWHINYGQFQVFKGRSKVGEFCHIDDAVRCYIETGKHVWKREGVSHQEVAIAADHAMRHSGAYEWKPIYLMRNS